MKQNLHLRGKFFCFAIARHIDLLNKEANRFEDNSSMLNSFIKWEILYAIISNIQCHNTMMITFGICFLKKQTKKGT